MFRGALKRPLFQATCLFSTKLNRIYSSTMMPRTNVELLNQSQIYLKADVIESALCQDPFVAAGRCFLTLTMMAAWWAMWLCFFDTFCFKSRLLRTWPFSIEIMRNPDDLLPSGGHSCKFEPNCASEVDWAMPQTNPLTSWHFMIVALLQLLV